jgi:uncharacterized protein (DUF58 family)
MTIDPSFLEELDRFDAALDRETASVRAGEQDSPRVGEGLTFADYRRYSPGDDTRLVDWRLFARTEEFYVKQYEEERALTVHLLVDASASMDYGAGDAHKFEYAAKVALGFAYLTAANHDDFVFGTLGERVDRLDAGRSSQGEVLDLIEQVNGIDPDGEAAYDAALSAYAERIRSRSLVVVVGDCLASPDAIETGVAALTRTDADVLVVRTVAPGERDPDLVGDVVVRDTETDEDRRTYFGGSLVETYRSRLDDHVGTVEDRVTSLGTDHVCLDTGTPFFDGFAVVWLG